MTATDELRRMLDERGVEWYGVEATYWGDFDAVESVFRDNALEVSLYGVSPQKAIDATLGRGECTDTGRYCFTCSECGWTANEPHHALGGFWPNFCPNCGARVVE